jgi:hypothetical protein
MSPDLEKTKLDSSQISPEAQEGTPSVDSSSDLNMAFSRTETVEGLSSTYSRYYLHFGVKAAALAMFADETLKVLKTGSADISKVAESFALKGDPLAISMRPLRMILPIPDRAFEISKDYWGTFGKEYPDRLAVLPSDFVSALGVGILGQPEEVPNQIFKINWQYRDLQQTEKISALLLVAETVWRRCHAKLNLPGLEWAEDPVKAAQIELVDGFFDRIIKGADSSYYLDRGRNFLSSLRREVNGKIGGPAAVKTKSAALIESPGGIRPSDDLKPSHLEPAKPEVSVPKVVIETPPLRSKTFPPAVTNKVGNTMRNPSLPSPKKTEAKVVREPQKPLPEDRIPLGILPNRIELNEDFFSTKEKRIFSPITREKVSSWSLKDSNKRSLFEVVLTAYRQDQFLKVVLNNGEILQGVVVFGAQRHDFFTLIDDRNENSSYPKFADVRHVEIYSQTGSRE